MNPLRQDDPQTVGPYHVIGRLDPAERVADVPAQRFIARDGQQGRTVVLVLPHAQFAGDLSYGIRFRAEAENSRRLTGPGTAAVVDIAPPVTPGAVVPAWYAFPFEAALPLPGAVAAVGGPLSVTTVCAVGAVLAEALATAHANGLVHAGITAENVLVTPEGPELTGYGLVRAAAVDGAARTTLPGIPVSSRPPEQLSGGRPRPLGDVFALGSVLAYAALGRDPYGTGSADETAERVAKGLHDLEAIPEGLRTVLAPCLAPDPADRPQMHALLDQLLARVTGRIPAPAGMPVTALDSSGAGAPSATALDAGTGRSAAALVPGWLPGRVVAAMSQLSADVLAAETAVGAAAQRTEPPVHDPSTVDGPPGKARPQTTRPGGLRLGSPQESSRRTLLTGVLAGAAGLALGVGGTIGWQATADGGTASGKKTDPLTAARRSRVQGAPPSPLWRYDLQGSPPAQTPVIWRNEVVVVPGDETTIGLDLRTGKKLWERSELWPADDPQLMPGGLVLVPSLNLSAVEPRTGRVRWREKKYENNFSLVGAEGSMLWFTTSPPQGSSDRLVAYDMGKRQDIWSVPLSEDVAGALGSGSQVAIYPDHLLLSWEGMTGASNPPVKFFALRRSDGGRLWVKKFKGVNSGMDYATTSKGQLLSSTRETLRSIDIDTGRVRWMYAPKDGDGIRMAHAHGRTVYTSDTMTTCALDADTGKVKWRSAPESLGNGGLTMTSLGVSASGRSVFLNTPAEIDVLDARSGKLQWRYADIVEGGRTLGGDERQIVTANGCILVRNGKSLYLLPMD